MSYQLKWHKPVTLERGTADTPAVIYTCDLKMIPEEPGVYMYTRENRGEVIPIYIGETANLRSRFYAEFRSLPLMGGIKSFAQVQRQLRYATLVRKSGLDKKRAVKTAENAMLDWAIAEGYELLNRSGTKRARFHVHFLGHGKRPFPKNIYTANQAKKVAKKGSPRTTRR